MWRLRNNSLIIITILFLVSILGTLWILVYRPFSYVFIFILILIQCLIPWYIGIIISQRTIGSYSIEESTIGALLNWNVYLCVIISIPAGLLFMLIGVELMTIIITLGIILPPTVTQFIGFLILLFISPFFLLFVLFVELPGMLGIAKRKDGLREKSRKAIKEIVATLIVSTEKLCQLQYHQGILLSLELESDYPFPLLSKILGGGLLALVIAVLVSLII